MFSPEENTELLLYLHGNETTSPTLVSPLICLGLPTSWESLLPSHRSHDPIQLPLSPSQCQQISCTPDEQGSFHASLHMKMYLGLSSTLPPSLGNASNCHCKAENWQMLKVSKVKISDTSLSPNPSPNHADPAKVLLLLKSLLPSASLIPAFDSR